MIFSERATSRNGPLALMTFSTARRRSLEPSTLNGNGRKTSSGSAHSVMTRTSLRSLRIGDSTRASRWSTVTATSIGCTASRPSPSIIVSATAIIVSKLRSDRKRGWKRSRSARRRSATSSANSATSAAGGDAAPTAPARNAHTIQPSAATASSS